MTARLKRLVFASILFPAIIVTTIGFYLYNKGPLDVKNSTGIPVTAIELYNLYSSDSLRTGKKYTDNILVVSGEVFEVSLNAQMQKVILLKTKTDQAFINCTFEELVDKIKKTDKISIKGICSGIGQGYPEMEIMGDVYLSRCFLVK